MCVCVYLLHLTNRGKQKKVKGLSLIFRKKKLNLSAIRCWSKRYWNQWENVIVLKMAMKNKAAAVDRVWYMISLRISKVDDLASEDYQWWWKAYKKQTQSKRRPEKTGQTPSDGKVSFTGMKFRLILGVKCSRDFLPSFCLDRSFI